MTYEDFLEQKKARVEPSGFEIPEDQLPTFLFDYQKYIVRLSIAKGKFAIFAGTGLGKTAMQLSWAQAVFNQTNRPVLILAPLAVAKQTAFDESKKFGIEVKYCETQEDVVNGINITNYEKLGHFTTEAFVGIVLDESSILKSFTGAIRTQLIGSFADTPYRLACSATPSPNDHMELGNHAEFLGIMTRVEMLAQYFIHDGGDTSKWRLKKHGKEPFWQWLASWSVMLQKPSDLGFSDDNYNLPPLNQHQIYIEAGIKRDGELFSLQATGLLEQRQIKKQTLPHRVKAIADLVNQSSEQWIVWCETNDESAELTKAIADAIEVKGADSEKHKEQSIYLFTHYQSLISWFGNQNTPKTEEEKQNLIRNIATSGILNRTRTEKLESNTNDNGTWKTGTKYSNKTKNICPQKMSSDDPDMQKMQHIEIDKNQKSKSISKTTQKKGWLNDCENTESLLTNTTQCLNPSVECAPFANNQSLTTLEQQSHVKDSTLTTATERDLSEDYFAQLAIWESENFQTIQSYLSEQQITCEKVKKARVLISKASIFGFGLNLQNCHNVAFVGMSNSFELTYQAIRRCYRFGQTQPVNVYFAVTDSCGAIVQNMERKAQQFDEMLSQLIRHMGQGDRRQTLRQRNTYMENRHTGKGFELYMGDCVETISNFANESIDYSVFSPPFSSLYTYSNSERDMGNSRSDEEFMSHFGFLVKELYRVIKPGRLVSFHCMDLPASKQNYGFIGLRDFRGELIRLFESAGFVLHSQVTIWKDPVIAMQRTKALGLLHKQLKKDSAMSRQGIPDYLVTMRKLGDNPAPINGMLDQYYGTDTIPATDALHTSIEIWQRYASPVWMDINPSDTLQFREARHNDDERHICPLQLTVIRRALQLWTNPGDLVLSPFAGIGSEGYVSLDMDRRFVGVELKQSYWECAVKNLDFVANKPQQLSLIA